VKNQVKVLNCKDSFSCKAFDVIEEQIKIRENIECTRFTVVHPGAVVIIPVLNDSTILMIDQYRHSIRQTILEFPAGTIEHGEDPLECAKREISEEVGYKADEWTSLGEFYPAPGFCSEVQHGYLAKNLSEYKLEGDEDEILEVVELQPGDIENKIISGEITDSKSITLFACAQFRKLL